MSLPLIAAFMFLAAQDSVTAPPEAPVAPVDGSETDGNPPAQEERADGASDEASDRTEEVCRRVTFYDDYGRQRSRRVCRPR